MSEFTETQKKFLEELFLKVTEKIEIRVNEIKQKIDSFEKEIIGKITTIEERLTTVETEKTTLNQHLLNLERRVRKNNLIIFGIAEDESNLLKAVCNIFQNILELQISETDINVYRIGKHTTQKTPVVVEFVAYQKKKLVLKETKKLKGTNIYISKYQCEEDRRTSKLLNIQLREARQKGETAYISRNKLFIVNKSCNAEQLKNRSNDIQSNPGDLQRYKETRSRHFASEAVPKNSIKEGQEDEYTRKKTERANSKNRVTRAQQHSSKK